MRPLKRISSGLPALVAVASLVSLSQVFAEDTKGKWQFGFGLSYMATVDYIRSNADLAYSQVERGSTGELAPVQYVDERPDANILNQPSIRDDFKLDFSASYGLTRWLALEAAVGYLEAPVGNIEFYNKDTHQGLTGNGTANSQSRCGPFLNGLCYDYVPQAPDDHKHNSFLPVGQLREIPIHLSGLIRFRPESPLDPYIGAGFGYIMTKFTSSSQFDEAADKIANMRVSTASEGEFTINTCKREGFPQDVGCNDFVPGPLRAQVRNAFEWHAVGGVDYYATDHFSVYVDARYIWTSGALDIRTDGAHQVRFGVADSGRLLVMRRLYKDNVAPESYALQASDPNHYLDPGDPASGPYLWEDFGVPANQHFQDDICPRYPDGHARAGLSMCRDSGYLETEDKNMNGSLETACDGPGGAFNYCEDEGFLYRLLPGSRDIDEALRIDCPNCRHNQATNFGPDGIQDSTGTPNRNDDGFDTEDVNGNGYLDRFLVFGIDICTTPQGIGHPRCVEDDHPSSPLTFDRFNLVWPEGCSVDPQTLGPFETLGESGCPPFLSPVLQINPATGLPLRDGTTGKLIYGRPNVQRTSNDNAADTYILQGGKIRMGGFSLGVGFKFTF